MRIAVITGACFLWTVAAHAARPDRAGFLEAREEVRSLALERIRSSKSDYERVLAMAESRLRELHETFQVAGGTPPTRLDGDLEDLRRACHTMRQRVLVGRPPDPDPRARRWIDAGWAAYRDDVEALLRKVAEKKGTAPSEARAGAEESQLYWDAERSFQSIRERTLRNLLLNSPPGERPLEESLARDEGAVLVACELTPRKTRAAAPRVVAPYEFAGNAKPDVQSFYRSLDLVPNTRPLRLGSVTVPPGARTVTLREAGARLVFRPRRGKGVAYLGTTETEIHYGYLAVPPDTAYYFETLGPDPLEMEFVALRP